MSESSKLPVQKLLAILVSPFAAIVLLLVAIVAALLYFGVSGPAIAAGAIVLVLAAGLFFGGVYLAKRRDKRAVDATIAGMTDSIGAQDNTPQARERVAKLRAKWEREFKKVRADYVKNKPILMIVGESKSGKSVLLDRSGLELESDNRQERDWEEGTENVDPWFFPEGLVLDTAGEMVAPAAGSARIDWGELVKLITTLRPRNPVSGVILAVPVWRLLSDDENARIVQANLFQREFQRLVHSFGVRFPVSVVVTMADLVDGYSEFALRQSAARPGDKYTMLGWPQYQLSDEFGGRDVMGESVGGITSRIEAQVLHDTCNPETASVEAREALEIWCFPRNIRSIGQRLADYLKIVFKEKQSERVANAPFFRGVFFGSSMQSIRRGEPRRKEPERPRSEPFNIRDLLAIRLFGEAGLVTTSPRAEAAARTRRLVGVGVPLVVAVVSAAVALIAFDLAGRVAQQKEGLQRLAARVPAAEAGATASSAGSSEWLAVEGSKPVVKQAVAAELAKDFDQARGFRVDDLPFWLGWYRGFADKREVRASRATELAWTKLVAVPLLSRAADEKSWLSGKSASGAYRSLALERPASGGGLGEFNGELGDLDRAVVLSLRSVMGPATTTGPARAALKASGGAAKPTEGSAGSLRPLVVAMMGGAPTELETLLRFGGDWKAPARAVDLAREADTLRERFLGEKFAGSASGLLLAADTHAAWRAGKVSFELTAGPAGGGGAAEESAEFVDEGTDSEMDDGIDDGIDDGDGESSAGATKATGAQAGTAARAGAETAVKVASANEVVTWNDVEADVWGAISQLGEAKISPSARWGNLAALIDAPDASARLSAFLPAVGASNRPRSSLGREPTGAFERIERLDALYNARDSGYSDAARSVIDRIDALKDATTYTPGTLDGLVKLDIAKLVVRPSENAKTNEGAGSDEADAEIAEEGESEEEALKRAERELRVYLAPAIAEFNRQVASYLDRSVKGAVIGSLGRPDRAGSRGGSGGINVLEPLSDFTNVDGLGLQAKYEKDRRDLDEWYKGLRQKPKKGDPVETAFVAAGQRIDQLARDAQGARKEWRVVDAKGYEPGTQRAQQLVDAILRDGLPTVEKVRIEVLRQRALLDGGGAQGAAKDPGKSPAHVELEAAIRELAQGASGAESRRQNAASFIASIRREPQASQRVESGIRAIDNLASSDEQAYWMILWRDLLVVASEVRDRRQEAVDTLVTKASVLFPLSNESDAMVASEVLALARDGAVDRPGDAVAIPANERAASPLDQLWRHHPVAKRRGDADQRAANRALALSRRLVPAGPEGPMPDARALRVTMRATGDWEKLGPAGVGAVSRAVVEADSNDWGGGAQVRVRVTGAPASAGGEERVKEFSVRPNLPLEELLFEWTADEDPAVGAVALEFGAPDEIPGKERIRLDARVLRGGPWSVLRFARELQPISDEPGASLSAGSDGFVWGALPVVDGKDRLYVAVGLKFEWVLDGDASAEKTVAIPIGEWLRESKRN